jgi:TonB family protein
MSNCHRVYRGDHDPSARGCPVFAARVCADRTAGKHARHYRNRATRRTGAVNAGNRVAPAAHFVEFVEKNLPPMHSSAPPAKTILHLPSSRPVPATAGRALALHAPRPDYPYEARHRNITGSGVVALTVDSGTGLVVDAVMEESAGSPILDQSALSAFRRWRFKIGTPPRVRIPVTFTITGAQL